MMSNEGKPSMAWHRFWVAPVAAERLALVRITTCVALLGDILLQQLPFYGELFASTGLEPSGYSDVALLRGWRWTGYFFAPAGVSLGLAYCAWCMLLLGLLAGIGTRVLAVCVWLITLAMMQRHYYLKNFGDSVLRFTTFMLMFVPSNDALSWDAFRRRRYIGPTQQPAWGLRLFQVQLCAMYCATAISKLIGPLSSTWYQGTSLHYALNDLLLARIAYPLVPVPMWVTLPLTYLVFCWEVLFLPLVLWRKTRTPALCFGILFHVTSFFLLEVGWFGFYVLCWYCAWIPDDWFERSLYPKLWARLPNLRSTAATTL